MNGLNDMKNQNLLENWLIDQRMLRSNYKKQPLQLREVTTFQKDAKKIVSVVRDDNKTWEAVGTVAGGLIAGGIYALSYPVTLLDGPLPVVDAAWALGLVRISRAGASAGGEIGSWFD